MGIICKQNDIKNFSGGDAEIMCTVRNNPKANPYPVSWMRLGNVVTLSSGSELQIKDHRMDTVECTCRGDPGAVFLSSTVR